jgi:hypothetical protein
MNIKTAEMHKVPQKAMVAPMVAALEARIAFLEAEVLAAENRGRHNAMHHVRARTLAFINNAAKVLAREGIALERSHAIAAELHDIMKTAVLGENWTQQ